MKVLMINKFLYPNGGSETYIFKIGDYLKSAGHEVQYFGMEHEGRCVGNRVEAYTSDMDFHGGSKLAKLTYPVKTIYSKEARDKLRLVLEDFEPDVCHLNNFNYQLTPSIILEIEQWKKDTGRKCRIIFTAHDYQLLCPNHMLMNPNTGVNCEKCIGGHFLNCLMGKCIHGSTAKSAVGMLEAEIWNHTDVYSKIDTIICCSEFMKSRMDTNPVFASKTIAIHNFIDPAPEVMGDDVTSGQPKKTDDVVPGLPEKYVLYFGRFAKEKGIGTLLEAVAALPEVKFVFAGTGPLADKTKEHANITNVGFQTGSALINLIKSARFSVYPSEWYENCPFSVMESQMYGTPVLGSRIGGIPELIAENETGELFESGNAEELTEKIRKLWEDDALIEEYSRNCSTARFDSTQEYCVKLMKIYSGNEGAEKMGTEKAEAKKAEAEKLGTVKVEAEKMEAEKMEAEKMETEKIDRKETSLKNELFEGARAAEELLEEVKNTGKKLAEEIPETEDLGEDLFEGARTAEELLEEVKNTGKKLAEEIPETEDLGEDLFEGAKAAEKLLEKLKLKGKAIKSKLFGDKKTEEKQPTEDLSEDKDTEESEPTENLSEDNDTEESEPTEDLSEDKDTAENELTDEPSGDKKIGEKKLNGTVIVTYRCNARCNMCNRYKKPSKVEEEISIETIKKLPPMYFTNITGGEPFIRTDLKEIVRELRKKSDRIVISTNGFFTDRIIDLCEEFPDVGIRISIEGLEETNNAIRGLPDGFNRGYTTLKKLRKMGLKDIGFGMTVQDANCMDLVKLYKISNRLGMEFATASLHNSFYFVEAKNIIHDRPKVAKQFERLINLLLESNSPKKWFRAYFNHGLINYIYGQKRLLPCDMSFDTFFIDPYGDVMPCNGTKDKEVMGNLNTQTWDELWNSPEAEVVRHKVRHCDRDCWMIGSVSPAMHKYIWKPAFWVFRHKFLRFFRKKKYSMYELKVVRDYRDGKLTKEDLDKCSTCDLRAAISDGLSETSRMQLEGRTGEEIVDADIASQMGTPAAKKEHRGAYV